MGRLSRLIDKYQFNTFYKWMPEFIFNLIFGAYYELSHLLINWQMLEFGSFSPQYSESDLF